MTSHRRSNLLDVVLTAGDPRPTGTSIEDTPFRILILGDFSGRHGREDVSEKPPVAGRRPLRIDRDNFDDVLGALNVMLHAPVLGEDAPPLALQFTQIDDFHPDSFHTRIEPIRQLYDIRRRFTNPATCHSAMSDLATWMQPEPPSKDRSITPPLSEHHPEKDTPLPSNLLDTMLDEAQRSPKMVSDLQTSEWQSFLRSIVSPYLVPQEDPRASELIGHIDDMVGAILRKILHHPAWQSLEALWRGLKFLVDRLETDTQLQLYQLDATKDELSAELCTGSELAATGLYRHLVNDTVHTPGGSPWAVIGGAYSFDQSEMDVALLHQMARMAHEAGAPFIAAGSPTIVGCSAFSTIPDPDDWDRLSGQTKDLEEWNDLRTTPEATALGLAVPRFLLRLPYGKDTDPIESFPFEEAVGCLSHEKYLWCNPVFLCLLLLGQAFTTDGWDLRPGSINEIDRLPLHVTQDEFGESVTTACAEAWLSERAAERLLDEGLMPVVSYKDQDRIRLMRFQSLASPPTSLMGRWNPA